MNAMLEERMKSLIPMGIDLKFYPYSREIKTSFYLRCSFVVCVHGIQGSHKTNGRRCDGLW